MKRLFVVVLCLTFFLCASAHAASNPVLLNVENIKIVAQDAYFEYDEVAKEYRINIDYTTKSKSRKAFHISATKAWVNGQEVNALADFEISAGANKNETLRIQVGNVNITSVEDVEELKQLSVQFYLNPSNDPTNTKSQKKKVDADWIKKKIQSKSKVKKTTSQKDTQKGSSDKSNTQNSTKKEEGVRVPVGVWYVSEDIPAGHYTINVAPDAYMSWGSITVGTALDETGKDIDSWKTKHRYYEQVKKKGSQAAVSQEEIDYDFKEGDILIVEEADMIFTPYVKKKLNSSEKDIQEGIHVPIGVWHVSEDLPVGHYTINVAPDAYMSWGSITVGTVLDETGKDIDSWKSRHSYYEQVKKKGSQVAVSQEEIDYDFKEGDIFIVKEADMVFTPYVKKKLGF